MDVRSEGPKSRSLPPEGDTSGSGGTLPRDSNGDREAELRLIQAAIAGDIQAFAEVFEPYRGELYAACLRHLGDTSLAEDVVQEVFIRSFIRLPNSDYQRPLGPWLGKIAHRMCIDLQRRRSLTYYSADITGAADEANGLTGSALDSLIASEERRQLLKELNALPKRQRRALMLFAIDGWSYADIAAVEGISVGAVKLLIVRARKRMRIARRGGLPAVVYPFNWLRWKVQRAEERARPWLRNSGYGDALTSVCAQAVCLGVLALTSLVPSLPTENSDPQVQVQTEETVWSPSTSLGPGTGFHTSEGSEPGASAVASSEDFTDPTGSLVNEIIYPNSDATPEETSFSSVTVSPAYGNDHTLLAGGRVPGGVMFVSQDGGATWKTRPSGLLDGGLLALPPGFPEDPRIFAYGGNFGLQQSDDGGVLFRPVSPIPGRGIAVSPFFGLLDNKLLIASRSVFEVDASTGVTRPALLSIPPSAYSYAFVSYSPGYSEDSTVFVAEASDFYRCVGSICDRTPSHTFGFGVLTLRFSPKYVRDGLAYGFTPSRALFSDDRAKIFSDLELDLPDHHYLADLAVIWREPAPVLFASSWNAHTDYAFPPPIYRSLDSGGSWESRSIDLPGFEFGISHLVATPTGRLLATGTRRGIACSVDLGETWRPRCPPNNPKSPARLAAD